MILFQARTVIARQFELKHDKSTQVLRDAVTGGGKQYFKWTVIRLAFIPLTKYRNRNTFPFSERRMEHGDASV